MSILITGGTGLIGSFVAERLLAAGETVVLFDAFPAAWRVEHLLGRYGDRLHLVQGDVQSLGSLAEVIRTHRVAAVMHLAYVLGAESNANPVLATQVNIAGTLNVLEAARLFDLQRVVMASSIAVYGADSMYDPAELPLTEDAPQYTARDLPVYGGGKVYLEKLAEAYTRRYGLLVVGMRPSIVYGWGRQRGASSFIADLTDKPALGQPATVGMGDARLSLVYVEDVAGQFVALLGADASRFSRRRFFNTGGDSVTIREVAHAIKRLLPEAEITVTSNGEQDVSGLAASVSDAAMTEEVGYRRQFPLETGLKAHINLVRARAGLPPVRFAT